MDNANESSDGDQPSNMSQASDAGHLLPSTEGFEEGSSDGDWATDEYEMDEYEDSEDAYDPYEEPDPNEDSGICIVCKKRPTSRKCAACGNDWVCCKACEMYMIEGIGNHEGIIAHMTDCNKRPKTTADIILDALAEDLLPTDKQANSDYVFDRCNPVWLSNAKSILLTLYHHLMIGLNVTPRELDIWMKEGKLYERIDAKIEARPEKFDSRTILWFKMNKTVFEKSEDL